MKQLYHFTGAAYLRPIAKHGLTVGDVPTDAQRWKGRVGVWLTSNATPDGHGLEGSARDKKRYRLTVELDEQSPLLHAWPEWARKHVTKATREQLHASAPGFESWFIYFGHIKPAAIVSCMDMNTGEPVAEWGDCFPPVYDVKPVPFERRQRWHKALIKQLQRHLRGRQ